MKRHLSGLVLLLALTISQFSCVSQLQIQTLLPAEAPVSTEQWKVVAINRYNPAFVPYEGDDREEIIKLYAAGAKEAFWGGTDAVIDDTTFLLLAADTARFRPQEPSEVITDEQIREIYQEHPFHLLLSLDHFKAVVKQEVELQETTSGSVYEKTYFTLVVTSGWSLYDSAGTIVDQVSLTLDDLYQAKSRVSGAPRSVPSISELGPAINELAYYTGYDYWKRLYPQPYTYRRPYYSSHKFEQVAVHMKYAEWEEAIALLKPLAQSGRRYAAKAAYNLAVVYEAMGQMEEATYWATEAGAKNDPLAARLLMDLAITSSARNQ